METILAIITLLAATFGIFKIINEIILSRTSKHRNDYQFAKDYLEDLNNPSTHRFVIEKGFRALANDIYSVEEIKLLLAQDEPTELIFLRSSTKNTITFDSTTLQYSWINIYKHEYFRKSAAKLFIASYAITAFLAMMPIYLNNTVLDFTGFKAVVFTASMALFAVLSVMKHSDFNDSTTFMKLVKDGKLEEQANTEKE